MGFNCVVKYILSNVAKDPVMLMVKDREKVADHGLQSGGRRFVRFLISLLAPISSCNIRMGAVSL